MSVRPFDDADRSKKKGRITLPENPDGLSADALARLDGAVQGAVRDGYITCPAAWRVAGDLGVSKLAVGVAIDRLGIRVTQCQLGCFGVAKTDHAAAGMPEPDPAAAARVAALAEQGQLTCPNLFAAARDLGLPPRTLADAANARGFKFAGCQLGCF